MLKATANSAISFTPEIFVESSNFPRPMAIACVCKRCNWRINDSPVILATSNETITTSKFNPPAIHSPADTSDKRPKYQAV